MKKKKEVNTWVGFDEEITHMGITCDGCKKREVLPFPLSEKDRIDFEARHSNCKE